MGQRYLQTTQTQLDGNDDHIETIIMPHILASVDIPERTRIVPELLKSIPERVITVPEGSLGA